MKGKLPPLSGSVVLRQLNPVHKTSHKVLKAFFFDMAKFVDLELVVAVLYQDISQLKLVSSGSDLL